MSLTLSVHAQWKRCLHTTNVASLEEVVIQAGAAATVSRTDKPEKHPNATPLTVVSQIVHLAGGKANGMRATEVRALRTDVWTLTRRTLTW